MPRRTSFRIVTLESAAARQRAGRVMLGVAVAGVLIAATGAVLGWRLVGELDATGRETRDLTVETLDTLSDTIDLADGVLGSTVAALDAVGTTLDALVDAFASGTGVITELGALAATAAPALADTTATLRQLEEAGRSIDAMLAALSDLPLGLDYDPGNGLATSIGALADTLEPLSDDFAATSAEVAGFSTDLEALRDTIVALDTTVAAVNSELGGTDAVIDDYRLRVDEARRLAEQTSADIEADTRWMRLLIVAAALNFAVGQIVPWWIGHELLRRSPRTSAPGRVGV